MNNKHQLLQYIMWDYKISPEECLALLDGRTDRAGHYTREQLVRKILESFSWFTVMDIISITDIYPYLTEELIGSLRSKQLRKRYAFLRERLQNNLSTSR